MSVRRRRTTGFAAFAALLHCGPVARAEEIPLAERRSGFEAMSPET